MLEGISSDNLIVGLRRSTKAIEHSGAQCVYVAQDIAPPLLDSIVNLAKAYNVPLKKVSSKSELGKACKIDVAASVVVVKKQ